jgi:peptide alpha-N-acetyltransferase
LCQAYLALHDHPAGGDANGADEEAAMAGLSAEERKKLKQRRKKEEQRKKKEQARVCQTVFVVSHGAASGQGQG